jgi:hypothetical protein
VNEDAETKKAHELLDPSGYEERETLRDKKRTDIQLKTVKK